MKMARPATAERRTPNRHVFSGDLEALHAQVKKIAKARKARLLQVADMDIPAVAVMVQDLETFVDQAVDLGGSVLYLSPDDLGVTLEEHIDIVDEVRESIPPGEDEEERETAEEMTESLVRLQELQNALGGAAFRLGYLRQGVMHELILEDDEAAPGAALVDLTLRGQLDAV